MYCKKKQKARGTDTCWDSPIQIASSAPKAHLGIYEGVPMHDRV